MYKCEECVYEISCGGDVREPREEAKEVIEV